MGNKGSKNATEAALNESEINILIANTHFNREQIVNYHKDFLHVIEILFLEIVSSLSLIDFICTSLGLSKWSIDKKRFY